MSVAQNRFRLPVAAALVGGVSALILAAVGGVILITFFTARSSTLELLRDRADLGLELLETRIRGQLDPITDVGNGLVALIADGEVNPMDPDQVQTAFQGALSAVPQAKAIIYVGTDLQTARVSRGEEPLLEVIKSGEDEHRMFTSLDIGGKHILMFREILGYGPQPWRIGLTFPASEVNKQLDQLRTISFLGLGILVVAVILGLWVGRTISRQISGLADSAPQAQHIGCCEHSGAARQPLQRARRRFPVVQRHDGRAAVV